MGVFAHTVRPDDQTCSIEPMRKAAIVNAQADTMSFAGVNPEQFKNAMARVPAAVHIAATDGAAGIAGFTASSATTVSLSPPIVLVCLNGESPQVPVFKRNGVFSLNLLTHEDRGLSDIFAGRTGLAFAERFCFGRWTRAPTGSPVLDTATLSLDCQLADVKEMGSHLVLFGKVVWCSCPQTTGSDTLIYGHRRYLKAAPVSHGAIPA